MKEIIKLWDKFCKYVDKENTANTKATNKMNRNLEKQGVSGAVVEIYKEKTFEEFIKWFKNSNENH